MKTELEDTPDNKRTFIVRMLYIKFTCSDAEFQKCLGIISPESELPIDLKGWDGKQRKWGGLLLPIFRGHRRHWPAVVKSTIFITLRQSNSKGRLFIRCCIIERSNADLEKRKIIEGRFRVTREEEPVA